MSEENLDQPHAHPFVQTESTGTALQQPPPAPAAVGDFYKGIEWFACWLLDNCEGETITEEQLRPWAVKAWQEHKDKPAPAMGDDQQFPSRREKTIIEVFQQKGDPAFICGVDGWITSETIQEIEKDINENRDDKDGNYLYEIHYNEAQTGDEGRIEIPAYWDLREIAFTPPTPSPLEKK